LHYRANSSNRKFTSKRKKSSFCLVISKKNSNFAAKFEEDEEDTVCMSREHMPVADGGGGDAVPGGRGRVRR
jgi:hypothetical protein